MTAASDSPSTASELLRQRDYMLFLCSRGAGQLAQQILGVTIGWQIYEIARRTMTVPEAALVLGLVGVVSFVPVFVLTLPAGEAADRYDRRKVMLTCLALQGATAITLTTASALGFASVPLILAMAALFGAARAYFNPSNQAIGPMLVPRHLLPRGLAWSSLATRLAQISGPAAAGVLVAFAPAAGYGAAALAYALTAAVVFAIRGNTRPITQPGSRWDLMKEGLAYCWNNKIVFGAISLDLVAVMLGGATALLPIFARDVLHVGPEGFGILRAATGVGGATMAVYLASSPVRAHAGKTMFAAVALFGFCTLLFGLSRSLWFSAGALAVAGACDVISVYVRQTLVQLTTPDAMRGRVSAVSTLFIGASNELGEAESGIVARLLGPIGAAIFGGGAAMAATGLWAWMFPALRKADRLE